MFVRCIDNDGFEDQLTACDPDDRRVYGPGVYRVVETSGGSFLIEGDGGVIRWYGMQRFRVIL